MYLVGTKYLRQCANGECVERSGSKGMGAVMINIPIVVKREIDDAPPT